MMDLLWMEEILHQLIDGKHPTIYRLSTIQGGAGFLPSTVGPNIYAVYMYRIIMDYSA